MRNSALLALSLLAFACSQGPGKKGPFVAEGRGVSVTAQEFKARLDEQSPFIRSRYTTLQRKKEFLDNLVRFEVLAAEARRQGLDKDPDVQMTLERIMVQKLVQRTFGDPRDAAKSVSDDDVKAFYDQHKDDYVRPLRLRVQEILLKAPAAGPEREKVRAEAKRLLERLRGEIKTNRMVFATTARERSQDDATKNLGGELGFKSKEELERERGKGLADLVFGLKDFEPAGPVETPQGFALVMVGGRQEPINRTVEEVKPQIVQRLYRERKTKEFEAFTKKLMDDAKVKVNEAELEKVVVNAPPPPVVSPGVPTPMPMKPHGQ